MEPPPAFWTGNSSSAATGTGFSIFSPEQGCDDDDGGDDGDGDDVDDGDDGDNEDANADDDDNADADADDGCDGHGFINLTWWPKTSCGNKHHWKFWGCNVMMMMIKIHTF